VMVLAATQDTTYGPSLCGALPAPAVQDTIDRAVLAWMRESRTPAASIAILRGSNLIVFRSRVADGDGTLADLVHQTTMYYEDRLKGAGFARVVVAGASYAGVALGAELDEVRRSLEERLTAPVETVDPRTAAALTDRITGSPALMDALAPLVGLLLRDRAAVNA